MKYAVALILGMTLASSANAICIGSGSLRTCDDDRGNSTTYYGSGSMQSFDGRNSRTGVSYSGDSITSGSTTFSSGRTSTGITFDSTTYRNGSSAIVDYKDSTGHRSSKICNINGCF